MRLAFAMMAAVGCSAPTPTFGSLPESGLWVLIHPTDAPPEGPGIVHIDANGVELDRLPLPDGVTSPHGLAWDGTSLWMTDYGGDGGLYQLDPDTGDVLSVIAGIQSEGVALDGDGFWVGSGELVRIDASGVGTERRPGAPTVEDLAFDGTDVLYLTNGDPDTVTRVAPDGAHRRLRYPVTRGNEGYAMALWDGALLVADYALDDEGVPYRTPVLRTVDAQTGEIVGTALLPVKGWITAIAPALGP